MSDDDWSRADIEATSFVEAVERAFDIAHRIDKKTPLQATAKIAEEVGELMREVLMVSETPGCTYRSSTHEKRVEELADVLLCVFATQRKLGITVREVAATMLRKSKKWEAVNGTEPYRLRVVYHSLPVKDSATEIPVFVWNEFSRGYYDREQWESHVLAVCEVIASKVGVDTKSTFDGVMRFSELRSPQEVIVFAPCERDRLEEVFGPIVSVPYRCETGGKL